MRELRVVGVSEDGSFLMLRGGAEDEAEEYQVAVDERLRALLRREPDGAHAGLSPREIQARLRAGESVEEVAKAADVPVERIEAYAVPVLSERAMVLSDALGATMSRPLAGPSSLPLGTAVLTKLGLAAGGPEPHWSTRRAADGSWVVEVRYASRGRQRTARWRWDRAARSLAPLDATAAELGHVEPGWTPELTRSPRPPRGQRGAAAVAGQPEAPPPSPSPPASEPAPPVEAPTAAEPTAADLAAPAEPAAPAEDAPPAEPPAGHSPAGNSQPPRRSRPGRRATVPAWSDLLLGGPAAEPTTPGPSEERRTDEET